MTYQSVITALVLFVSLLTTNINADEAVIENSKIKLTINSRGGRISSLTLKNVDLALKGQQSPWQGLAKERVFSGDKSSLLNNNFSLEKKSENTIIADNQADYHIHKKYTLLKGKAAIKVDVSVTDAPESVVFAIHNFLPGFSIKISKGYFYSLNGKVEQFKVPGDFFVNKKGSQWFMTKTDDVGIGIYFDSPKPDSLSSYLAGVATMEWKYAPISSNGKLNYSYTIYLFNPNDSQETPKFLQNIETAQQASATNEKGSTTKPVNKVAPLITETPMMHPKKSGYIFASNFEQIAYVATESPSMIHFKPINKSHHPDLFLALPKGIKFLDGFRNFRFVPQGEKTINGETFNVIRIVTAPSSSKYTFIWQAEPSLKESGKTKFKGYFWGEWADKKQKKQVLNIELVSIPQVTPFKKIPVWLCLPSDLTAMWPDYPALRKAGFNYLDIWTYIRQGNERNQWGEKAFLDTKKKCDAAGIKLITWFREWWWHDGRKDVDGAAIDIDGNKTDELCPSYRGKYFEEWLEQGRYLIDKGSYFHSTDPEMYRNGEKICFCPTCIMKFREFLAKKYPNLKYKSPIKFEKMPEKYKELHTAWNDFKASRYADFFREYREKMEQYMQSKGINAPFRMVAMTTYHRSWDGFYGYANYKESPVYLKTLEDPAKLSEVFDFLAPMAYMDVYANYQDYDMLLTWKDTISLQKIVDKKCSIAPMLCAGYPFVSAFDCDTSAVMLKNSILESFMGGGKGFSFWGECPVDAKDMQAIAEVVGMLSPYEKVILDGKPSNNIKAVSGNVFAKRIKSPHGSLVLISEYSKRAIVAKVQCPVTSTSKVINLKTGKQIATITPAKSNFSVELNKDRAVIFYIGAVD